MELLHNLSIGFSTALTLQNLFYCFVGSLLGTLIGVLPGIGPAATIAVLLPVTYSLTPESAVIMLAGIYYGAQYGGSTTAILLNLPGEATSAVTAIDGYQMARQGRAGPALAISAIGSFFAGSVATFVLVLFALPLTRAALEFGPQEYFALIVLGLICAVALANGSIVKALATTILGLLFGLIGSDVTSGLLRFTLGHRELADGLDFVAIAVGIFGFAEIIRNLETEQDRSLLVKKVEGLMPTLSDLKAASGAILRGTAVGSLLGILPGGGALLASFASYALERKLAKDPTRFGRGAIEGVAGPESANNAGAQTSFIPVLTLGIPSNAVMALMVGALTIHGIAPGPNVVTERPALFWGLIASMWIGNFMLVLLNLPLVGLWVRLLTIPYYLLFPAIIGFSALSVFLATDNVFHLYTLAGLGLLGYLLHKLECEPTPLLLGFVLGPMLEENFLRSMAISRGDPTVFFTRPISATLLLGALLLLVFVFQPSISRKREEVFVED